MRCNASNAYVRKQVESSAGTGQQYLKIALYIAAFPTTSFVEIMGFGSSSARTTTVGLDSAGKLGIYSAGSLQGTVGAALNTGQWYTVEFKGGYGSSAEFEIKVDEVSYKTATFTNGSSWNYIEVGLRGTANSADLYIDDVVLDNSAYPGASSLAMLKPNAAGDNAEWTPSTGSNYATVDEVGVDDADYVSTTVSAEVDLYNMEAMPETPQTINAVYFGVRQKVTNTSFATVKIRVRDSGTDSDGAAMSMGTTGSFKTFPDGTFSDRNYVEQHLLTTKPSGGAWTESAVNAMQVGVVSSIAFTNTTTVSKLWAYVEYVAATVQSVNVSDTVTITESVNVALVHTINKNDTVTVTESVALTQVYNPSVFDSVTVTESVTVRVDMNPSVFDSVTVTESITRLLTSFINVFDTITVTDSPNVALAQQISVFDGITVTDVPNIALVQTVNKSETVTVTESVTMLATNRMDVFDAVTVTDIPNVAIAQQISVADAVVVENLVPNGDFEVGTGTTNANFLVPGWSVTIPGAATVVSVSNDANNGSQAIQIAVDAGNSNNGISELSTFPVQSSRQYTFSAYVKSDTAGELQIQFRDDAGNYLQSNGITWNTNPAYFSISTTTSYVKNSISFTTGASQTGVRISDFKRSGATSQASRTFWIDTIVITDSFVTVEIIVSLNVSDTVTVTDVPNVALVQQINKSETVTVTDVPNVALVQQVSVFDGITVTESVNVRTILNVSVSDSITVTDVPTVAIAKQINVFDSVNITESTTMLITSFVNVSDSITVTDAPTVRTEYNINVSDQATVSESVTAQESAVVISVSDSVTVSESVTVSLSFLSVNVNDSISVSEEVTIIKQGYGFQNKSTVTWGNQNKATSGWDFQDMSGLRTW